MKTYFISDTHFHHKNILRYEPSRLDALKDFLGVDLGSFTDDEENQEALLKAHDDMLIKNWNDVVKGDDFVWFLGDLCCCGKERAREITSRLNGRKRMIKGNHDVWSDDFYRSLGFEYVSKYPVVLKKKFILSHAPLDNESTQFYNIYGHIHLEHCKHIPTKTDFSQCVCVERQNFKPIRIEEFDKAS